MKRGRDDRLLSLLFGVVFTLLGLLLPVWQWLTGRVLCHPRSVCPQVVEIDGWFYLQMLMYSALFLIPGILAIYYFLRKR